MSFYKLGYDVALTGDSTQLPPVRLCIDGRGFRLQDFLTPDEAADLGARLTAMALKASPDEVVDVNGKRVRITGRPVGLRRIDNPPEDPSAEYALEDRGVEPDSPNDWPEP